MLLPVFHKAISTAILSFLFCKKAVIPARAFAPVTISYLRDVSKRWPQNVMVLQSTYGNNPTANATETLPGELLPSMTSLKTYGKQSQKSARHKAQLSPSVLPLPASRLRVCQDMNRSLFGKLDPVENRIGDLERSESTWKERLVDVSNIASFLCVLDCTLLPLVSVAVPALSWVVGWITSLGGAPLMSGSSFAYMGRIMAGLNSFLSIVPALGHSIALYFVIPVGLLTAVVNYFYGHKKVRFAMPAFFGVLLIFLANNSNGTGIAVIDGLLSAWGVVDSNHAHGACEAMTHVCSAGLAHRLTNTLGCAFLLGSNYASRKFIEGKTQGCAASALAQAWGGDGGKTILCGPNCGCNQPFFGTSGSSTRLGGETFFQWKK